MAELRDGSVQSTNPCMIDQFKFMKRLQALYLHWCRHKDELWGSADFFVIASPPPTDDIRYLMSSTLNIWLLGYEFPETITVFGSKQIHFLCSQEKAGLLKTVKRSAKKAVGVDVVIHAKLKGKVGTLKMDAILRSMRMSNSEVHDAPIVGSIVKHSPEGSFLEKWTDKLKNSGLELSDVIDGLSDFLTINDLISETEDFVDPKLERVIGEEKKVTHSAGDNKNNLKSNELVAYRSVNDIPPHRKLMILVDQKNEVVLLPIYGLMVPFHVATVKRVSSLQDSNRNCYIRIIFNVPGTPFTPHDANGLKNHGAIYLKEASFSSKDPGHISKVVQQIRTLRRNIVGRESERAERSTVVMQAKLELAGNKFKSIRLSELFILPPLGGRAGKMTGALAAHANGFRYSTSRQDERVDIMYANIKHAFFQPAETEKEMITLLHFRLRNHIMVGNKETKDVQFYMEVVGVVETLGGGTRSTYDPNDFEEERDGDRKNKVNMDFQNFVNRVHGLWVQPQFKALELEFEQPLREVGFHGVVPDKGSAFIVPTSSCLVELVETPVLIISLSEIEIVNLERIGLGQKDFDMAIVFKDFKHDVMRINCIPSTSLDGIKVWLDTTEIEYFESSLNLHWRAILKTFTDDPQTFIDAGSWEFLNRRASDFDGEEERRKGGWVHGFSFFNKY